ncbi:MAG: S-adenosylmethionine:tRNA ribosyltransferase-isomerase [Bacteroidales bacterium]|nr:S-adenosylmethionine:tRNA ribosyltransferase-isomerase [Bacteroidales bacterium]
MIAEKNILLDDYNYELPDNRIAKYPLKQKDKSKLLVFKNGTITDNNFENIADYFSDNSLIVFNNTKVIQARLEFEKETGAKIEIFCLEPYFPSEYVSAFQQKGKCSWKCIVGNLKKWKNQSLVKPFYFNNELYSLKAEKIKSKNNSQIIEFTWDKKLTFSEVLENIGVTPIPPYLNRKAEESDKSNYQTIYSKYKGSVAAPTAGLHFTKKVFENLEKKNIKNTELTLHVGAGTFIPVKSKIIGGHVMHTEHFMVKIENLKIILKNIKNIVAVGTTTVRTLESIYWLGVKIIKNPQINPENLSISQWEVYEFDESISSEKALKSMLNYMIKHERNVLFASTQIIIVTGYDFKIVKTLITNFHQPKSTLLLLVSAFIGENWKNVYKYALDNNFRFLSYGDSCLFFNQIGEEDVTFQ